jgi:Tfp pilus assembly protein PilW
MLIKIGLKRAAPMVRYYYMSSFLPENYQPLSHLNTNPRSLKGQTIVEIIIAVALAAMVVTALVSLNGVVLKTNVSTLKRAQANKVATLAMEAVRYHRDSLGYTNAFDQPGIICFQIATESNASASLTKRPSCGYENVDYEGGIFRRKIEVSDESVATQSRKVTVSVEWDESTGTRRVIFNTYLSKWR